MSIFYLISPSLTGSELQEIYFLMDKKPCKNSNNIPQDIFWIDPTQIKAKTSKENFSCGPSSTVLQLCEIQVMNDKQSFELAPTFYFHIHPSQDESTGLTASKQNANQTQKSSMTGFLKLFLTQTTVLQFPLLLTRLFLSEQYGTDFLELVIKEEKQII